VVFILPVGDKDLGFEQGRGELAGGGQLARVRNV
jgi:hypothetical protein